MSESMVERVKLASFQCWRKRMDELGHHMDRGRTLEDMNASEREFAEMLARAAIEAMREPTEAMVEAEGDVLRGELGGLHDSAYWSEHWPANIWRTMIDAALKS